MRWGLVIVSAALLAGCTISVVDKRLTREEVAAAFKQRDNALMGLAQTVKELKGKNGTKTSKAAPLGK